MSMPSLAPPGQKMPFVALLMAMLMPLFMALAYPGSFIAAMHKPVPHHLVIEVVGTNSVANQLAQKLSVGGGDALDVRMVPDADTARTDVLNLNARAAYDPAKNELYFASAAGRQAAQTAQTIVQQATGQQPTVHDLKAPNQKDPSGTSFMYFVTVALTTGYMTASFLNMLGTGLSLRKKLGIQLLFSGIASIIVPSIFYGFYGIYSAHLLDVMAICAGLFFTASVVQMGMAGLFGQLATLLGITIFVILGIPASGIGITKDMLPDFFNVLHRLLPSGAGEELLRRVLYFDGVGVGPWILQLLVWTLIGAGLTWVSRLGNVEHTQVEPAAGLVTEGLEKIRQHPDESVLTAYHDPVQAAPAAENAAIQGEVVSREAITAKPTGVISPLTSVQASTFTAPTSALGRLGKAPPASAIGAMQDPTKPPARPVNQSLTLKRMLTAVLAFPLFMMTVMPLLMGGTTTNIMPRSMDVALIGTGTQVSDTAQRLQTASSGKFEVSTLATVSEARSAVADHTVRAAYDPRNAKLYIAGANGGQVNAVVRAFFTPVAQASGKTLTVNDLVPLAKEDPIGATTLYLALGAVLGGFMTGIILSLMPVGSKARIALGVVMPAVFATAMVLYGWTVFGIFSGSAGAAWGVLYLLSLTCLTVTAGLMLLFGPVAMPIAILLIPLLGMATAGVATPLDMVNGFYGSVHHWLFSSQGIAALRDALYFPGVSLSNPVLIMLAWLAAGLLLAVIATVQQKRRHLFAMLRQDEEARAAVAIGAAAI